MENATAADSSQSNIVVKFTFEKTKMKNKIQTLKLFIRLPQKNAMLIIVSQTDRQILFITLSNVNVIKTNNSKVKKR